jgi:divalent metal cation (Fe/Co/Zn/Cd) transporter
MKQEYVQARDITEEDPALLKKIESLLNQDPQQINCHNIRIYQENNRITLFLHCELNSEYTTEKIETISREISDKIRGNIDNIAEIHLHVEPLGE